MSTLTTIRWLGVGSPEEPSKERVVNELQAEGLRCFCTVGQSAPCLGLSRIAHPSREAGMQPQHGDSLQFVASCGSSPGPTSTPSDARVP